MKKHIYILATGGTIAGKAASEAATTGYEAGAIGIADLLAAVSEVRQYADVEGEQIASIDSKDMTSAIWLRQGRTGPRPQQQPILQVQCVCRDFSPVPYPLSSAQLQNRKRHKAQQDGSYPEPDDDLGFRHALELKMMMQGCHAENTFAACPAEVADL